MDEAQLIEKLRRVENLFAGAATDGEREAAASALDRMRRRLEELQDLRLSVHVSSQAH
jgi:hypothetical protein